MIRKVFIPFLLLLLIIKPLSVTAQDAKFKALFVYNFTKYLEWPAEKQKGNFIIGVYGSSDVINELNLIAQKKKAGNQTIIVRKLNSPEEVRNCHILFVPENKSGTIDEIIGYVDKSGTVIITDKPGLAKKSGINFIYKDGKQNFEINKQNIESRSVKVNSALLSLGMAVN